MDASTLTKLYTLDGPFTTIYVAAPSATEDAAAGGVQLSACRCHMSSSSRTARALMCSRTPPDLSPSRPGQ